jgi:hypothetical protein
MRGGVYDTVEMGSLSEEEVVRLEDMKRDFEVLMQRYNTLGCWWWEGMGDGEWAYGGGCSTEGCLLQPERDYVSRGIEHFTTFYIYASPLYFLTLF